MVSEEVLEAVLGALRGVAVRGYQAAELEVALLGQMSLTVAEPPDGYAGDFELTVLDFGGGNVRVVDGWDEATLTFGWRRPLPLGEFDAPQTIAWSTGELARAVVYEGDGPAVGRDVKVWADEVTPAVEGIGDAYGADAETVSGWCLIERLASTPVEGNPADAERLASVLAYGSTIRREAHRLYEQVKAVLNHGMPARYRPVVLDAVALDIERSLVEGAHQWWAGGALHWRLTVEV